MVRETIGGSAFRVKNPTTAKKDKDLTSCFGLMADSAVVDSALVDAALRKSGLI